MSLSGPGEGGGRASERDRGADLETARHERVEVVERPVSVEPISVQVVEHGTHEAQPSAWPVVVGAGVTLLMYGVITGWFFAGTGLITLVIGLTGWMGELVRESAGR